MPSFFLKLFLHWSPVAYWAPTDLGGVPLSVSYHFAFSYYSYNLLGWCKSNCDFCILNLAVWYWNVWRRHWLPTPVLLPGKSHKWRGWYAAVHAVSKSQIWLSNFTFTFHFHALEKEMATHSSVLAWRIPGVGETDGLTSIGSQRVEHDWSDLAGAAAALECIFYLIYFNWRVITL